MRRTEAPHLREPVGLGEVERARKVPGMQRIDPYAADARPRPTPRGAAAGRSRSSPRRPSSRRARGPATQPRPPPAGSRPAPAADGGRRHRGSPSRDRRRCGSVSWWCPVHVFGLPGPCRSSGLVRHEPVVTRPPGNGFGQGPRRATGSPPDPHDDTILQTGGRLSRLPRGRQARADLSTDKSAK